MKRRHTPHVFPSSHASSPTEAQIQTRAYELYVEGGRQEGQDREHWLRAEKELWEQAASHERDSRPAMTDKSPLADGTAPEQNHKIQPLDEREYPFARGKRGSASRDEIRNQQVHPAARRSH